MEETHNLQLPYIVAAQAQKHITHNEALHKLDTLVQLSVKDRVHTVPPTSASEQERYIIASHASALWQDKGGLIAVFQDDSWFYYQPQKGWRCWVEAEEKLLIYNGINWDEIVCSNGENISINPAPLVGVNTTADEVNRLAVKSNAVLLSHDDITSNGNGDMQVKVNKGTANSTASVLFQDDFSGHAEMGLTGDDDFHVKVSDDGTTWKESIIVDKESGSVSLPQNSFTENMLFNLLKDAGRFAGSPEPASLAVGTFTSPNYLNAYNGTIFSGHVKFIHNNNDYGGSSGVLDPDIKSLVETIKSTTGSRRNGPEFWAMKIKQGNNSSAPLTINGVTYYLSWINRGAPLWPYSSWGMHVKALTNSVIINDISTVDLYVNGVLQTGDVVISVSDGWKQIIYVSVQDAATHYEYNVSMHQIFMQKSAEMLMALPFIFPAQLTPQPGKLFGRVGSLEAWR